VSPGIWLAFLIAAAIGAPARYLLDGFVQARTGGELPWGTCVINITGSFLLGLLSGLVLYQSFPVEARLVLGTGFCGAYTTFSTFTFETLRLAEGGTRRGAVGNILLNTAGGLLAAAAGLAVAAL
jgi:fluoride exporter